MSGMKYDLATIAQLVRDKKNIDSQLITRMAKQTTKCTKMDIALQLLKLHLQPSPIGQGVS